MSEANSVQTDTSKRVAGWRVGLVTLAVLVGTAKDGAMVQCVLGLR